MISTSIPIPEMFMKLAVPWPPALDLAIGYGGEGRFFMAYPAPLGPDVVVCDGRMSRLSQNHLAFWALVSHPAWAVAENVVRGGLRHVFDRVRQEVFAAPDGLAWEFLASQWPARKALEAMSAEESRRYELEVIERLAGWKPPTLEEVRAMIEADARARVEMVAWLDAWRLGRTVVSLEKEAS